MSSLFWQADNLLRGRPSDGTVEPTASAREVLTMIVLGGMIYGATMGSFRGLVNDHAWQILYSACKVPLLLLVTFMVCLPSFFVVNSLLGLRQDFGWAVRNVLIGQAGIAIILTSMAPLTAFWYVSETSYNHALLINTTMFAVASFSGQILLRRYYRPLIKRNAKHGWMLWAWIGMYALVGIQLGWVLRPFVGSEGSAVQFLRPSAWDNAYLIVLRLIWRTLTGS